MSCVAHKSNGLREAYFSEFKLWLTHGFGCGGKQAMLDMIDPVWLIYAGIFFGPFVQEDAAVIAAATLSATDHKHGLAISPISIHALDVGPKKTKLSLCKRV